MNGLPRILFIYTVLAATLPLRAQTFKVTRYTQKDSLVKGPVYDISQDSAGFIWIANNNGLQRYNGEYFIAAHRDTLSYLQVHGNQLVGGYHSVFKFHNQYPFDKISFESLPVQSAQPLRYPFVTVNETGLWSADANGIHNYHNKKRKNYSNTTSSGEGFMFCQLGNSVFAMQQSGQLFYLSSREDAFLPLPKVHLRTNVNDVLAYTDSSIVVATDSELLLLTVKGAEFRSSQVLHAGEGMNRVARDHDGNIWVATAENRLLKFYPSDGKFVMRQIQDGTEPHRVSDLQFPDIIRLFVDRHNNLWVCHMEGLALVSEIPFVLVDPDLPNEIIRSAAFMGEGKAYLSGIAGFFETVNLGFNDYEVRPANVGKNVYPNAICKCGKRLWLGTVNDELYYFENGKLSEPLYKSDAINIFYLYCDSKGDVWVSRGQRNRRVTGLLKITKDLERKVYDKDFGFSTRMLVTREDARGNVFIAGIGDSTYLYRYDRERDSFKNLSVPMEFDYGENFEVHDFVVSGDSTFWLASTAGLLVLKDDSIRRIEIDELYGKEVVAVTLAPDNVIWAATEKDGIVRYKSDDDYALYNIQAGLQSGIMWYRSLFTDDEGKLWAGSREGITVSIHPNPQARKTETPILLSVIDNGVNNLLKHIFNFKSTLRFEFISLNYPTRSIEYQYKLNEDSIWSNLRLSNKLILPELQSGNYTLHVRARQSGGYYWSEPLDFSMTILPPWYLSREAFLVYAIFIVVLLTTGTRFYNRRLIREKNRLEIKVRERTHELVRKQDEIIAQNQELHQLSDVLAANHENIVTQKEIIEKQNFLLQQSKQELEKKVEERTHELKFANEELAQQNVQLEQFAFMTAHNLRAPVARLLGLTSLLEVNTERDENESELLKRIKESSKNLDDTIREISEILHIKKGLHGSFTPVNLKAVWDRMFLSFGPEIEGNSIEIKAEFRDSNIVRGVEPFVYSVFYNILSNSIKYADARKKSFVHARVVELEHSLQIIFEDNGIGFSSSNYSERLFKPFTRFNNLREGRGLGLYLMKLQMEMMGGRIELYSEVDVGTRVTLMFQRFN